MKYRRKLRYKWRVWDIMVGIYFSGTGNSRYAAELFCKEYDEATKAFSLEDDNITRVVKNEEMLVFACPVQYSTVPKILRDFIIEIKNCGRVIRFLLLPRWDCLVVMVQAFLGDFCRNTRWFASKNAG